MTDCPGPLPRALVVKNLPGPKRGAYPALYFRDEVIWSPEGSRLALAYTITEASMMNEIGCLLWACFETGQTNILENPREIYACCWRTPWCGWIDGRTFVFKLQLSAPPKLYVPLVAINVSEGFCVIPHTDTPESWIDQPLPEELRFQPFSARALREAVLKK